MFNFKLAAKTKMMNQITINVKPQEKNTIDRPLHIVTIRSRTVRIISTDSFHV